MHKGDKRVSGDKLECVPQAGALRLFRALTGLCRKATAGGNQGWYGLKSTAFQKKTLKNIQCFFIKAILKQKRSDNKNVFFEQLFLSGKTIG